jgi:partner of Y14 and mago protein
MQPTNSVSGIIDGVIPESRRPDGTIRKERKVRPGFVAAEDVTRYTNNRMEAAKRPPGYVPGLGVVSKEPAQAPASKNAKKNAKKQETKTAEPVIAAIQANKSPESNPTTSSSPAPPTSSKDAITSKATIAADIEKKIKNIKKKLRQIEETEAKGGDLLPEQMEKIAKKGQVQDELKSLEEELENMSL